MTWRYNLLSPDAKPPLIRLLETFPEVQQAGLLVHRSSGRNLRNLAWYRHRGGELLWAATGALRAHSAGAHDVQHWANYLVGLNARALSRTLKRETGMSYRVWHRQIRLLHALELLALGDTGAEVARKLGYQNIGMFRALFQRHLGKTPGEYFQQPQRRLAKTFAGRPAAPKAFNAIRSGSSAHHSGREGRHSNCTQRRSLAANPKPTAWSCTDEWCSTSALPMSTTTFETMAFFASPTAGGSAQLWAFCKTSRQAIEEVHAVVQSWPQVARSFGADARECYRMESAFLI